MFCKSRMVVCIHVVLRFRAVIGEWEYSCMVLGSVSLWICGGDVGICGCVWGVEKSGSFGLGVSCILSVCWLWRLGRLPGGSIPCTG